MPPSFAAAGLLAAVVLMIGGPVSAQEPRLTDRTMSINYLERSPERLEQVIAEEVTISSTADLRRFGQAGLTVNDHFSDFEVLEAETIKADGRRIPVAPDKILISAAPDAPRLGMFMADVRTRTIVFPDLAIGDRVRSVVRLVDKAPVFPGGTSFRVTPPAGGATALTVTYDVPQERVPAVVRDGFEETVVEKDGRRVFTWTLDIRRQRPDELQMLSPIDQGPKLIVSTYAGWDAIGRTFLDGAEAAGKVTPAVTALAADITRGISDRKEQARAIYDWVSANIRYIAIFFGHGGVVPHDVDTVIANKYGDCKDHATLMRALLAAQGIDADFVLINTQPTYIEPKPASGAWFNHVILYLPEFNIYSDPTAAHSPFSVPPANLSGKAGLRLGRSGVALVRTPVPTAVDNRISVAISATVLADGSVEGTADYSGTGAPASLLRKNAERAAKDSGAEIVRTSLARFNWPGTGTIDAADPFDHTEPYRLTVRFRQPDSYLGQSARGRPLPTGPRLVPAMSVLLDRLMREGRPLSVLCLQETYEESIELSLPEGYSIGNLPEDVTLTDAVLTYTSRYRLLDGKLRVERRAVESYPGPVCEIAAMKPLEPLFRAMERDFSYRPRFVRKGARRQTEE